VGKERYMNRIEIYLDPDKSYQWRCELRGYIKEELTNVLVAGIRGSEKDYFISKDVFNKWKFPEFKSYPGSGDIQADIERCYQKLCREGQKLAKKYKIGFIDHTKENKIPKNNQKP